mmetsp:Transcript_98583/g.306732  ORF Transcript_98583/g.306732 Transcript_98583/m.306732 type:complete len:203 (+) Transcript_98583:788-1396(+)
MPWPRAGAPRHGFHLGTAVPRARRRERCGSGGHGPRASGRSRRAHGASGAAGLAAAVCKPLAPAAVGPAGQAATQLAQPPQPPQPEPAAQAGEARPGSGPTPGRRARGGRRALLAPQPRGLCPGERARRAQRTGPRRGVEDACPPSHGSGWPRELLRHQGRAEPERRSHAPAAACAGGPWQRRALQAGAEARRGLYRCKRLR